MKVIQRHNKAYFALVSELARAQFKLKDQSTFFGLIWSFLHPILMLSLLFLVFHLALGSSIDNYAIYLLVGLVQYTHFSNTTGSALGILSSMNTLCKNAILPKETIVIGTVVADIFEFAISLIFCLIIALFMGVSASWVWILLPVIVFLQILFVLWVSLFLSIIYVFVKDIKHIYQVFLRMLFFITPIFYELPFLGEGIGRWIVLLNPLTQLIQFSRMIILEGVLPPLLPILLFFSINFILIYIGLILFRRKEASFAEYL